MFKKNNFKRRDRRSQATTADKNFSDSSVTIRTGGKEITIRNARNKNNNEKPDYKKKRNIGFDYGAIGRGMR